MLPFEAGGLAMKKSKLKIPRSKLRGIFPVMYWINLISLANPMASHGVSARMLVHRD